MPIRSRTNLYPGINPHLNNALQKKGGDWRSFHSYHIIYIAQYLNHYLPDAYYAKPEKSLQIGTYDGELTEISSTSPTSDVLITLADASESELPQRRLETDSPVMLLPMPQYIDDEDELDGLLIYHEKSGKAVTRIELLSPANMPRGSHHSEYLRKRYQTLKSGVRLVEIDYLHLRDPISDKIFNYRLGEEKSRPYHIIVSDPRPNYERGKTKVYSFGVLDVMPNIDIPLEDDDYVIIEFTEIYNLIYAERLFWREVDYEQEPLYMDSFMPVDQQAIRDHMVKIQREQSSTP